MVFPIQLLQGASFGALWLASVAYASSLTPEGMSATSQGALAAVMSLGSSLGNLLAGQFYEALGAPTMFRWSAAGIAIALIFFVLFGRRAPFARLRQARRDAVVYEQK
jgi:MFS family permease